MSNCVDAGPARVRGVSPHAFLFCSCPVHTRHHRGSRPRETFCPVLLFLFSSHLHLSSAVSLTTPFLVASYVTVLYSCPAIFNAFALALMCPFSHTPICSRKSISTLSLFLPLLPSSLPLALTHNFSFTHSRTRSFPYLHVYKNTRTHTHIYTHRPSLTPTHTCMTPLPLSESRFHLSLSFSLRQSYSHPTLPPSCSSHCVMVAQKNLHPQGCHTQTDWIQRMILSAQDCLSVGSAVFNR